MSAYRSLPTRIACRSIPISTIPIYYNRCTEEDRENKEEGPVQDAAPKRKVAEMLAHLKGLLTSPPDSETCVKYIDLAETDREEDEDMELSTLSYRDSKYFGPGKKTRYCIDDAGIYPHEETATSGFTWICVYGTHCKCAVTLDLNENIPSQMPAWAALVMALVDTREFAEYYGGRPFVVVAVAHPDRGFETLFEFLEAKLRGCSSLSGEEASEIAVCALKHFWGPEFNPSKIKARSFGMDDIIWKLRAEMEGKPGSSTKRNKKGM